MNKLTYKVVGGEIKLLASQKNELYDCIEKIGFSPIQFELDEQSNNIYCIVYFLKTDFFFLISDKLLAHSNNYELSYSPAHNSYKESVNAAGWSIVSSRFDIWLHLLYQEINTPNKWERLQKEIDSLAISFDQDDSKFSIQEFELLETKIKSLKQKVTEIGLISEQVDAFNNKLDYLIDSAKRSNKFDWKSLFIGTIVNLTITMNVTPENTQALWLLIKQVFNNYFLP
ncbi:MAG: hypothetical protein K8S23_10990 [Candidatus Cloacimonetes bacterium]|nr:hypothetical protein [Candidatus Cloacimonadota bacterium]